MLHSPAIADPCQPSTVNPYAIGAVDVRACAVPFVNRARNQNERRIAALTATPKDGPRPTSIKSSMRPPRAIGLLIR